MIKPLICLLFAAALVPAWSPSPERGQLLRTGLSDQTAPQAGSQGEFTCPVNVAISRDIKYGEEDANVVEIATATKPGAKRPILVFIADDGLSDGQPVVSTNPFIAQAICVAADRGLVAFHVRYRKNRTGAWPEGMKDIAAAISWIFENADLFGGNAAEIIPIGHGTGASYLANFLSNKAYRVTNNTVAGAVLISGNYQNGTDNGESVMRGLIDIGVPIVLAWSPADQPRSADEGEQLRSRLCLAGQCPRTAVVDTPANPASVFDLDGASTVLHERLRQLIGQIDARELP